MISWEEAEQIMSCNTYNGPIKSSLPQQTRPTEPDNDTDVAWSIQQLQLDDPKLKQVNLNNMKVYFRIFPKAPSPPSVLIYIKFYLNSNN